MMAIMVLRQTLVLLKLGISIFANKYFAAITHPTKRSQEPNYHERD